MSKPDRRIAIFGATGSIGVQSLDVILRSKRDIVSVLTAGSNWQKLAVLANQCHPEIIGIHDKSAYSELSNAINYRNFRIIAGEDAQAEIASEIDFDFCINALVGVAGLIPSYETLKRGVPLALANKESLVLAGELLNKIAVDENNRIIPIDSEHSAIQQCLVGEDPESIKRIILTASGGPFREWKIENVQSATREQALDHPTWKMGAKISIDSATLMNKGMEVIEAYQLFDISIEQIEVRIHPVSIVHSMVEFVDGSFKAQLGKPDMRLPIQYALSYPGRIELKVHDDEPVDWPAIKFYPVEKDRYPCLQLAFDALNAGGTATAVLNGADEAAVARFLDGTLEFGEIHRVISAALNSHKRESADNIQNILAADSWGRGFVDDWTAS